MPDAERVGRTEMNMNMQVNTVIVADVVEKYTALLDLEKQSGTKTTRARNEILRSLDDDDLVAVSVELKRRGVIGGGK